MLLHDPKSNLNPKYVLLYKVMNNHIKVCNNINIFNYRLDFNMPTLLTSNKISSI